MLETIMNVLSMDTFWVAIGALGAVVALAFTYMQLRASRIISAADFLLRLESHFTAQDMLAKRKQILLMLKQSPTDFKEMDVCRDVFDFFEEVGLLLRKKILPTDLVWSDYCSWVLFYWTAFKNYVDWARKSEEDPTLYCEFEYLFKEMKKYENHRLKKEVNFTSAKLAEFVDEEINLLSNEIRCA